MNIKRTYKYAVAVKDYESDIYMEIAEFSGPMPWKEVYIAVVGDDYFGEDEHHKGWIQDMPEHFSDAKKEMKEGGIDAEILTLGYTS